MNARVLAWLVSLMLPAATATASVTVEIVDTDPRAPATLGRWEQYYVRVAYNTDRPIRVRGDLLAGGKRVTSTTGGSPRYEPGSGEAMFWFAYTTPAQVDTVLVWAEDEKTRQPVAQTQLSADLTWTGLEVPVRPRPEWVTRMRAEEERRAKEQYDAYMSRPTPWWQTALFFAAVWSIPGYFIAQLVALWRLRGGWRIAAAIPAVPMTLVLAHAIFAFRAGSNLFPLGLIFTCPFALLYLLGVLMVRRFRRA